MVAIGLFEYRHAVMHKDDVLEARRQKATLTAEIIKNGLVSLMADGSKHEGVHGFMKTLTSTDLGAVRLMGLDGRIISSSDASELGKTGELLSEVQRPGQRISAAERQTLEGSTLQLPIFNERACRGCHAGQGEVLAVLSVDIPSVDMFPKLRRIEKTALLSIALIIVFMAIALSIITSRLVTKPIEEISNTMRRVEGGDLKARLITGRQDEIGRLAASLNSMLHELNKTRHELQLCHEQDMQKVEKMATVGELAAAIAHDIKNPLAGISGAIQVFAEDFSEDDPRRAIVTEILSEIERLDRSVKDLLNYARPPEPNFIKTPILPIIERVYRLISAHAKKQDVAIQINTPRDLRELYVDPEQIQQVFLNIMLNALQSMPKGGKLTVNTSLLEDADMVEISFADTGHGIPEHNLRNIFKPFFTTKHTGTGLGMAIAKNTIEKHGGKILVDSRLGAGSTFRILLPLEVRNG